MKKESTFKALLLRTFGNAGILAAVTLVLMVLLYLYTRSAFGFIRHTSSSVKNDFSLRLFFYLGLLVVSFFLSLLADRILHHSFWLNHMLSRKNEDPTVQFGRVGAQQATFYLTWFLVFILGWFAYDRLNDRFHNYYSMYGRHLTDLRSPVEENRLQSIEKLSRIHKPEVAKLLVQRLKEGTDREKVITAWSAGQAEFQDETLINTLYEMIHSEDELTRHTVYLALTRLLAHPTVDLVRRIEQELRKALGAQKPPPKQLLFAASFLRTPEYLPLFMDFFSLEDPDTSVIVTYSIVWLKGTTADQNRRILAQLVRNMEKSPRIRCMNTVALLFKADELSEETLSALRREFEAKSSDFSCKPEVFSLHPFLPNKDTLNITRINIHGFQYSAQGSERYRERILRVLARVRDDNMIPWLERMSKNEHLPEYIRDLCRQTAEAKPRSSQTLEW